MKNYTEFRTELLKEYEKSKVPNEQVLEHLYLDYLAQCPEDSEIPKPILIVGGVEYPIVDKPRHKYSIGDMPFKFI